MTVYGRLWQSMEKYGKFYVLVNGCDKKCVRKCQYKSADYAVLGGGILLGTAEVAARRFSSQLSA